MLAEQSLPRWPWRRCWEGACSRRKEAGLLAAEAGTLAVPAVGRLAVPAAGRLAVPAAGRLAVPAAGRLAVPAAGRLAVPTLGRPADLACTVQPSSEEYTHRLGYHKGATTKTH